jgi:hypothetical protein
MGNLMSSKRLSGLVAVLFIYPPVQAQDAPTMTQAELTPRTQQIYDAVASGDRQPWRSYFADGGQLYAQRSAAKPYHLFPESVDLFFRAGAEGRRLFHRVRPR